MQACSLFNHQAISVSSGQSAALPETGCQLKNGLPYSQDGTSLCFVAEWQPIHIGSNTTMAPNDLHVSDSGIEITDPISQLPLSAYAFLSSYVAFVFRNA